MNTSRRYHLCTPTQTTAAALDQQGGIEFRFHRRAPAAPVVASDARVTVEGFGASWSVLASSVIDAAQAIESDKEHALVALGAVRI